ncbi:MAG: hypothetical protein AB7P04_08560 [Bacteriovoracia bacterium]
MAALVWGAPASGADSALDLDFLKHPVKPVEWDSPPPEKIVLGDQLKLKITDLNEAAASEAGDLQLKSPEQGKDLRDLGWALLPPAPPAPGEPGVLRLIAVPLKSGKLMLPSLAIVGKDGQTFARSNPFPVEVIGPEAENGGQEIKPAELKDPVKLSFPWMAVAFFTLLILGIVGAIVYAAIRWSRGKRKSAENPLPAAPPIPYDLAALNALTALAEKELWKIGKFKQHYFRVSEIIKVYLGERYDFDAPESTSSEIVAQLEALGAADQVVDQVEKFFDNVDIIKFADSVPTPEDAQLAIKLARRIVEGTRKLPEVTLPPPGGRTS